jgi:hypothetical protein
LVDGLALSILYVVYIKLRGDVRLASLRDRHVTLMTSFGRLFYNITTSS